MHGVGGVRATNCGTESNFPRFSEFGVGQKFILVWRGGGKAAVGDVPFNESQKRVTFEVGLLVQQIQMPTDAALNAPPDSLAARRKRAGAMQKSGG